jgi:hypothetical protein
MSSTMRGKVVALHEALRNAELPHAFGGALALAYYAEPRPTADIDLNVFVAPPEWPRVREALRPLSIELDAEPDGDQIRLPWDSTEVHVFLSSDPLHEAMADCTREVPLGGSVVPIVAAEHLVIRKAMLNRDKDWQDIEAILSATDPLDVAEIKAWLEQMTAAGDPRSARLLSLVSPR